MKIKIKTQFWERSKEELAKGLIDIMYGVMILTVISIIFSIFSNIKLYPIYIIQFLVTGLIIISYNKRNKDGNRSN